MAVDFTTPEWLIVYYHVIGTISLILNAATIYLVIFQSSKIDNFRYFILGFQLSCTITDFHLTFVIQAVVLYPILAGFTNSFLAIRLDIHLHYLAGLLFAAMVVQMGSLAICFVRKHQTIATIINRHVAPTWFMKCLLLALATVPVIVFGMYSKAGIQRDTQMDFVREKYPQLVADFSSLRNFCIYELNLWFIFMACFALVGGLFAGAIFTFSTIDMFRMLKGAQRKVSAANYKRHQSAVKSLLAQFATSSLCLVPALFFLIVIITEFQHAQGAVQILIAIFALHSSANAVVLISTTPPYRTFVLRKPLQRPKLTVKVSHSRNSGV